MVCLFKTQQFPLVGWIQMNAFIDPIPDARMSEKQIRIIIDVFTERTLCSHRVPTGWIICMIIVVFWQQVIHMNSRLNAALNWCLQLNIFQNASHPQHARTTVGDLLRLIIDDQYVNMIQITLIAYKVSLFAFLLKSSWTKKSPWWQKIIKKKLNGKNPLWTGYNQFIN